MAKARKSNNLSSSTSVQQPTPVVTETIVPPPVVEQTTTPVPVSVPVMTSLPAVVESVVSVLPTVVPELSQSNLVDSSSVGGQPIATQGFQGRYESIVNRIKTTQSLLRDIHNDAIILNREYLRSSKPIQKKKTFKKSDNSRSGITQEVGVSSELETFLGLNPGSKISRTSVTRAVTEYIKTHNLQNPANRRHIILDSTLSKLLNPPSNEQVTYFNLQKFLKVHYVGSVGTAVASTSL